MSYANDLLSETASGMDHYSVIIVGGGAAGIGAAVGARNALPNARILLIESEACLGGAATHRGVVSYCGVYTCEEQPRQSVGGVWNELKPMLVEIGATTEKAQRHRGVFQVIDPEGLKFCLDELMEKHNIDVLLHAPVVKAERDNNGKLTSISIQERRGQRKITADAFVDCSGECDLAYHAGSSTRYGNHGTLNLGTMSTRWGGIPKDIKPTAKEWSDALNQAKQTNPSLNITKLSSVLLRLPTSNDIVSYWASSLSDARSSLSISQAEKSCRKQAQEYLSILRTQPGCQNIHLVSTGHNFGTRESRHMNSLYQLTQDDITTNKSFKDTIALGSWGLEWHKQEDYTSTFSTLQHGVFEIPLGCLRSRDIPNLFAAGRCVDADQYAGSSVRVMGTALATGQAAGTAAGVFALGCERDPTVSETGLGGEEYVTEVRRILRRSGALLDRESLQFVEVEPASS